MPSAGETALSLSPDRQTLEFNGIHALTQLGSHASFGDQRIATVGARRTIGFAQRQASAIALTDDCHWSCHRAGDRNGDEAHPAR